jgi:hypothetical protein
MRSKLFPIPFKHLFGGWCLLLAPMLTWAGTSSPIDLGPILLIIVGFALLVVALSIYLVAKMFRGRLRLPAILVVLAAWGLVYELQLGGPGRESQARHNERMQANTQCNEDLIALSQTANGGFFEVDGFLDEVAALRKRHILTLFTHRKLKFVELMVQQRPNGTVEIAYPDGESGGGWGVSLPVGSFVRLELSREGDSRCLADTALPYGLNGRINAPPFLPDTCLAATYSSVTTARYSIAFANLPQGASEGLIKWQLTDRKNNTVLASLTDVRPDPWVSSGSDLSTDQKEMDKSCGARHTALVDRLRGVNGAPLHPQVLARTVVVAKQSPKRLNESVLDLKVVHPSFELFSMDDQEYSKVMNPWSIPAEWPRAINEAKSSGFASYDRELVDWESRSLYRLQIGGNLGEAYPWQSHPFGNGFLVWSGNTDWSSGASQLLAFYSKSGVLEWAKQIKVEKFPSSEYTCSGAPRSVQSSERSVKFYQGCRVAAADIQRIPGRENEGIIWTIDRREFLKSSPSKNAQDIQTSLMQKRIP